MRTIEVRRDAISRTRAVTEAEPHPADGQAVLRVERFSLSANNLTYARLGDELGYWRFFPAADGWGRLPVWAYAEVTASNCAGVSAGRRRVRPHLPDVAGLNYTVPHQLCGKDAEMGRT